MNNINLMLVPLSHYRKWLIPFQDEKTREFIQKAKLLHGDKYDYRFVKVYKAKDKVCILCKKHSEFWQTPYHHLEGRGCSSCAHKEMSKRMSITAEIFIKRAVETHGSDKYNYDRVNYIDYNTKVEIYCNTCKKYFWQAPRVHLNGYGCPTCGLKKMSETKTRTTEEFIKQAKEIHGNKYNYDMVEYLGSKVPVKIYCNICKEYFWQTPVVHLRGGGCPSCVYKERSKRMSLTTEDFIKRSKEIYGENKFNYSLVKYVNKKTPVNLICNDCGVQFSQKPSSHLAGFFGCNCKRYHGEVIIDNWLRLKNFSYKAKYITDIIKIKQPIVIDFKLIYNNQEYWIEYNGRQHYAYVDYFFKTKDSFIEQLKRDNKVREYCKYNPITLIEVPYTLHNEKLIFDFLENTICLGIDPNSLIDYESLFEDFE